MSHVTPIFLFSLPRAGSTLVQRVLGAHPSIATTSEPWLLLPFFYVQHPTGLYAEYDHREYVKALEDFCNHLPGKNNDYLTALRAFALHLYGQASPKDATYFLDKTPRYHLIAAEIMKTFPESKVIFLWRNPLAVIASMMQTWSQGKWNLYRFKVDLYKGLASLIDSYRQTTSDVYSVRYEDLITAPETHWRNLFSYLELSYDATLLDSFRLVHLEGRLGDPTGIHTYNSLSQAPLDKWKSVLNNPLRKAWAHRYLSWIGEDRMATMGYSLEEMQEALKNISTSSRFLASDVVRMCLGKALPWIEPGFLHPEHVPHPAIPTNA